MERVHIESSGVTGRGSLIRTESGELIHGVRSITVDLHYQKPTVAHLEVFASFSGMAQPAFEMIDPLTGKRKHIERIVFSDGSAFEGTKKHGEAR